MSTRVIPFNEALEDEHQAEILSILAAGGVIVYPTDTIYGLGGDFTNPAVHERIDHLKGRTDLPYSCAVGDIAGLHSLAGDVPQVFAEKLEKLLPGPYTFILPVSPKIDRALLKGRPNIGIRMPDLPPLLELIRKSGVPWITTSVNCSGQPPLNDPDEILRTFSSIDLFLDAGNLVQAKPSTVVDLSLTPSLIVREGMGAGKIREILSQQNETK